MRGVAVVGAGEEEKGDWGPPTGSACTDSPPRVRKREAPGLKGGGAVGWDSMESIGFEKPCAAWRDGGSRATPDSGLPCLNKPLNEKLMTGRRVTWLIYQKNMEILEIIDQPQAEVGIILGMLKINDSKINIFHGAVGHFLGRREASAPGFLMEPFSFWSASPCPRKIRRLAGDARLGDNTALPG